MMRKALLLSTLLALALTGEARATTYYVANTIGVDTNSGLTVLTPFKTIFKALSVSVAGDTVCVNDNGTYNAATGEGRAPSHTAIVEISVAGTATAPFVLKACNNHRPIIEHGVTNKFYYGIRINTPYVTVGPGFTVYGGSDKVTVTQCLTNQGSPCTGSGITISATNHVTITGNVVYNNASGGIGGSPAPFVTPPNTFDYIDITNNIVYNNAFYAFSGFSGVSLYNLTNLDHNTGYHNHITGNYIWGNRMYVNETGTTTQLDGNGLIIDDSDHTQHANQGPAYDGSTYIANNILAFNGSTGGHAFHSSNVDFVNNTFYHNIQSYANKTSGGDSANCNGHNVRFWNNLVDSDPTAGAGANFYTIMGCAANTQSGGNNMQINAHINPAFKFPNDIYVGNPMIANPMTGPQANWYLEPSSPVLGKGDHAHAPYTDFFGRPRPNPPSIGATEVNPLG